MVEAQPSRAVLDAWDEIVRLSTVGAVMLIVVNGVAFWSVARLFKPIPVIADGLERLQRGDLAFRLPPLPGSEANVIGSAFNRMAEALEDKVRAERQARDAEARLEERREMASLADQRVEEERRLIAHELHDEFGQSVTAIRSLALAIAAQSGERDPAIGDTARLISDEAARLYDAMHSLIPRLAPLSLDALGLSATLENLVRDWQRRHLGGDHRSRAQAAARPRLERGARRLPRGPGGLDQRAAPRAGLADQRSSSTAPRSGSA